MQPEDMIAVNDFCIHHNIEYSFIFSLMDSGLIEIITIEERKFIPVNQISQLEKMIRLYYEMNINLEGIETITYLLQRMNEMQQQIRLLNNKLSRYE